MTMAVSLINMAVSVLNIVVSIGLIHAARTSIRTSRLNMETASRLAQAIEARRAVPTEIGAVEDESAVAASDAP